MKETTKFMRPIPRLHQFKEKVRAVHHPQQPIPAAASEYDGLFPQQNRAELQVL